nr:hypothetical protein [uncultured Oscillibacter sp.]
MRNFASCHIDHDLVDALFVVNRRFKRLLRLLQGKGFRDDGAEIQIPRGDRADAEGVEVAVAEDGDT